MRGWQPTEMTTSGTPPNQGSAGRPSRDGAAGMPGGGPMTRDQADRIIALLERVEATLLRRSGDWRP